VSKALDGASVLMVDDDADGLALLQFVIELAGATVQTAPSGSDALDILKSWTPDVMMLDISLPEMDGYELLKQIRSRPALRNVPAIAVTAHAYERDKQRATEAGFSVHVSKPFDAEALVYLVAKLKPMSRFSEDPPLLRDFQAVLAAQGVHEALGFLNRRAPHRFTGLFKFDGLTLRSLFLFDRLDPKSTRGIDGPLRESYGSIIQVSRQPLVLTDAANDPRTANHPASHSVASYCGVLLRSLDGTPFGTLCHFDAAPMATPAGVVEMLLHAAPVISGVVADGEAPPKA
jgi:CheY-like chemotaxis protein